jgi:hypothetical protein
MREVEFPNTTEKLYFSELLVTVRRDKDNGPDVDLDCFLSQIVDVSSKMTPPMTLFRRRSWQSTSPMTTIAKKLGDVMAPEGRRAILARWRLQCIPQRNKNPR